MSTPVDAVTGSAACAVGARNCTRGNKLPEPIIQAAPAIAKAKATTTARTPGSSRCKFSRRSRRSRHGDRSSTGLRTLVGPEALLSLAITMATTKPTTTASNTIRRSGISNLRLRPIEPATGHRDACQAPSPLTRGHECPLKHSRPVYSTIPPPVRMAPEHCG
jgi:hypothetical protein